MVSVLALKHVVLTLLGNGFTELDGTVREDIGNNQHDGIVRLVIQRDGHGLGFVIGAR